MLPGGRQQRQRPTAPAGAQVALGGVGVVAGNDGGVEDLLEGMPPGLAGLELDQVQELLLAGQDQVVVAQQNGSSLRKARRRPSLLGGPGVLNGQRHIGLGAARHDPEQPAREGLLDLQVLALALDSHPPGQVGHPLGRDPAGGNVGRG